MRARILVIEDNNANIELIDYVLRGNGYTSLLATNGDDGIRIAVLQHPDLILLDIRMPGINGYEVASAIRKQPGLEQTPIVAVTASAMVGDRERIAAAGFDGYIQKPIDPETFVGQIERFLPERCARRHATAGEQ
ncbi:MAG: response regulator [Solirubrobacteraceae bacterium]